MAPPSSNQRDNSKVRGSEVFVGGLKRNVTEEAIREFFADCGEISEIRIMRDQAGAVKGYCFVRFASKEASLKAQKTKNDTMFQGKKIGVNQSSDQYTLYLGGIRKDWSLEDFEKIVKQAFQDVQLVDLIMQPNAEETGNKRQRNRGFGFVDFVSHAIGEAYCSFGHVWMPITIRLLDWPIINCLRPCKKCLGLCKTCVEGIATNLPTYSHI